MHRIGEAGIMHAFVRRAEDADQLHAGSIRRSIVAISPTTASGNGQPYNQFAHAAALSLRRCCSRSSGMHPAASPMAIDITIWKNFITMPSTAVGICAYCCLPENRVHRAVFFHHVQNGRHGKHDRNLREETGHAERKGCALQQADRASLKLSRRSAEPRFIMEQVAQRHQRRKRPAPATVATAAPIMPQWQV